MAPPVIFIFGLGYVGRAFGHMMAAAGWSVRGTTRQPDNFTAERGAGWDIIPFRDQEKMPDPARALDGVSAILSTIAPIFGNDPVLDLHSDDLAGFSGWVGYLSATSVYPDRPDGICYEDTKPAPSTKRGKARLDAEAKWQKLCNAELFRAAGIYGPGRSAFDGLLDGTARIIEHEGHLFNRIHRDDICRVITAALSQPRAGRIINLTDQNPASQGDVVRHAAALLGVTPPVPEPLDEALLSPMARSFYRARRHIGSRVIKPELGVDLLYPDYKAGLAAILQTEKPTN